MKALVLEANQSFTIKDIETPVHKEDEALIKVAYCGICGSDLARYFDGKVHNYPIVLGHEFSGTVEAVGASVDSVAVGDRVVVAPLLPNKDDAFMQKGSPALSSSYSFLGSRENGAMAEYVVVKAENLLVLPETVTLEEAALIEPLTVAIHGIERIVLPAGEHVYVLGAGTIGIMTILALKARGAGKVTAIDINDEKLAFAKKIGADDTINSLKEDPVSYASKHGKPGAVIETAGVPSAQEQAVALVEKKGKIVFVGTASGDVTFPAATFEKILREELEITGSWMSYSGPFPGYEWQAAIDYIASGKIDVKPLIHDVFKLEDGDKPFQAMKDPDNHSIKLLYQIAENEGQVGK